MLIQNLYQMALKKGNEDAAVRALTQLKSLYNFHDTSQKVDPKKLEASVYKMVLPRPAQKMLKKMADNGIMDFMSIGAEDVEWQDVTNEEEEDE